MPHESSEVELMPALTLKQVHVNNVSASQSANMSDDCSPPAHPQQARQASEAHHPQRSQTPRGPWHGSDISPLTRGPTPPVPQPLHSCSPSARRSWGCCCGHGGPCCWSPRLAGGLRSGRLRLRCMVSSRRVLGTWGHHWRGCSGSNRGGSSHARDHHPVMHLMPMQQVQPECSLGGAVGRRTKMTGRRAIWLHERGGR